MEEEYKKPEKKMILIDEKEDRKRLRLFDMVIIGKYLRTMNDFINLSKTNKEYEKLIEQFEFNPIPINNEKEMEIFKNMKTMVFYDSPEVHLINDKRIEKYKHFEKVNFFDWEQSDLEHHKFTDVVLTKKNIDTGLVGNVINVSNPQVTIEYKSYIINNKLRELKYENIKLKEGITIIGERCFVLCYNLITNY